MIQSICDECGAKKSQFIKPIKASQGTQGGSIDVHKLIQTVFRAVNFFKVEFDHVTYLLCYLKVHYHRQCIAGISRS